MVAECAKSSEKVCYSKPTFGQLLNKYTKDVQQDRPLKKRSWSSPHQAGSPIRKGPNKRRGDIDTVFPPQRAYATMLWVPSESNATNLVWEHKGVWIQCFPMTYPLHYLGEGSRTPVHDRLGLRQSGQQRQAAPVRPVSIETGPVPSSKAGISYQEE